MPQVLPGNCRHIAHRTIDSTNLEARRLFDAGERGPVWISAQSQQKGRGRHARHWHSPPGNLYATLLVTIKVSASDAPALGFAAGLAIYDALCALAGTGKDLALKWPNDVLLHGRKISGQLVEKLNTTTGAGLSDAPSSFAIGCGINLARAPDGTRYGAVAFNDIYRIVEPFEALEALADSMHARLQTFAGGTGKPAILAAFAARATGLGEKVQISDGRMIKTGIFQDINKDGALMLAGDDGTISTHYAGDVSLTTGDSL